VSLPQRGKIVSGHRQHLSRGVPSLRLTSTLLGLNGLGSSQREIESETVTVTGHRELVHDERESFIGGYKLAA
jgi:hypothetical protein